MNSHVNAIIDRVLEMEGVKVEVDKDLITIKIKCWDGYKTTSCFHSQDIIGYGFVSIEEIYKKLDMSLPQKP